MKYVLRKENDKYYLNSSHAFGIDVPIIAINNSTKLFGLPFPNIGSNGSICWGGNSSGGLFTSLFGLNTYVERLFTSPFNNHIWNSSLLKLSHNFDTVHDFFGYLQTLKEWDTSLFEKGNYTIGGI